MLYWHLFVHSTWNGNIDDNSNIHIDFYSSCNTVCCSYWNFVFTIFGSLSVSASFFQFVALFLTILSYALPRPRALSLSHSHSLGLCSSFIHSFSFSPVSADCQFRLNWQRENYIELRTISSRIRFIFYRYCRTKSSQCDGSAWKAWFSSFAFGSASSTDSTPKIVFKFNGECAQVCIKFRWPTKHANTWFHIGITFAANVFGTSMSLLCFVDTHSDWYIYVMDMERLLYYMLPNYIGFRFTASPSAIPYFSHVSHHQQFYNQPAFVVFSKRERNTTIPEHLVNRHVMRIFTISDFRECLSYF